MVFASYSTSNDITPDSDCDSTGYQMGFDAMKAGEQKLHVDYKYPDKKSCIRTEKQ